MHGQKNYLHSRLFFRNFLSAKLTLCFEVGLALALSSSVIFFLLFLRGNSFLDLALLFSGNLSKKSGVVVAHRNVYGSVTLG